MKVCLQSLKEAMHIAESLCKLDTDENISLAFLTAKNDEWKQDQEVT